MLVTISKYIQHVAHHYKQHHHYYYIQHVAHHYKQHHLCVCPDMTLLLEGVCVLT